MLPTIRQKTDLYNLIKEYCSNTEWSELEKIFDHYQFDALLLNLVSQLQSCVLENDNGERKLNSDQMIKVAGQFIYKVNDGIVGTLSPEEKKKVKALVAKIGRILLWRICELEPEWIPLIKNCIKLAVEKTSYVQQYDSVELLTYLQLDSLPQKRLATPLAKNTSFQAPYLIWLGSETQLSNLANILVGHPYKVIKSATQFIKSFGSPGKMIQTNPAQKQLLIHLLHKLWSGSPKYIDVYDPDSKKPSFWPILESVFVNMDAKPYIKNGKNIASKVKNNKIKYAPIHDKTAIIIDRL